MLHINDLQTKGYEEFININGKTFYQTFAIKNFNKKYISYYYIVPEDKLDQAEDYEIEEFNNFDDLDSAIQHIKSKGADINKFNVFKGSKPL